MHRHIDILAIAQAPIQYVIFGDSKIAGYCLITGTIKKPRLLWGGKPYKEAALWHIYIVPEQRRKKYATNLLDALKHTYDTIYAHTVTEEGKALLINAGFVKDGQYSRWTKKNEPINNKPLLQVSGG